MAIIDNRNNVKSRSAFDLTDMVQSAESLFIEDQLLKQTKLPKPDLEYDCSETDKTTNGCNEVLPCRGTYKIFKSDKKSIFTSLWSQKPEVMIDPTQQDFCDSDVNNKIAPIKEVKSSEFSDEKEYKDTKIMRRLAAENIIKVPNCIVFSKRDDHCGFQGKIFVSNICDDYITYRVSSSNAQKFRYFPEDIGWVPPNSRKEIFVQTNRLEARNFEDIATEVFQIQATSIRHKEQLDMTCLDTLWTAYGTEMFPAENCEVHLIKDVYPKEHNYLDNLSMFDRLKFAFFKTIKAIDLPPSSCSDCSFYESWPVNSQSYTVNKDHEQRADIVMGTVEEIEKTKNSMRKKMIYAVFLISTFAGVSAIGFALYGNISATVASVKCVFQKCVKR